MKELDVVLERKGNKMNQHVCVGCQKIKECDWSRLEQCKKENGMNLTNEQAQAYFKAKGSECPNCGTDDPEGGELNFESGCYRQKMKCNNCDYEWDDCYHLTSIIDENGTILDKEETKRLKIGASKAFGLGAEIHKIKHEAEYLLEESLSPEQMKAVENIEAAANKIHKILIEIIGNQDAGN